MGPPPKGSEAVQGTSTAPTGPGGGAARVEMWN